MGRGEAEEVNRGHINKGLEGQVQNLARPNQFSNSTQVTISYQLLILRTSITRTSSSRAADGLLHFSLRKYLKIGRQLL